MNNNTHKYLIVSLLSLIFAFFLQVITQRYLLADGVGFFLQILAPKWFTTWDYPRQFAHYLTQWPVVMAIRVFDVHDMPTLSSLYGASLYAVPLVTLGLCAWLLPRGAAFHLLFPAFAFAYFSINSSLFVITESHLAVGCFWVVFFYLMFTVPSRPSLAQTLVATLTAFASIRVYEFYFFFGPFLTALALWRSRQDGTRDQPSVRWGLYAIAFFGLVGAGIGFYFMIFSERSLDKVGLGSIFAQLACDPTAVLSSTLLVLFVLSTFLAPGQGARLASRGAMAWAVVCGIALGMMPLSDRFLPVELHYGARVLNLLVPFGLAMATFIHLRLNTAAQSAGGPRPAWATLLVLMLAWNASWQVAVSGRWTAYLDRFEQVMEGAEGVVSVQDTPLKGDRFIYPWTLPSLSIVLFGFGTGDVHAMLTSPAATWEPFHAEIRSELPDLRAYGINYRLAN